MKLKQRIFGAMLFFAPLSLMAADNSKLKTGMSIIMGIGAIIAFVLCFYFFIAGILHHRNGGDFGKDIIGVVITAASGAICSAIFYAFGMGEAVLTPTF
jgi:drug/metabolite transporter (DMT)-like permease